LERELTRVGAGGAAAGPGQRERKLFPRLQAAPFLSAEVKAQITERFYTVESLKGSEAAAAEVLDQIGPPAAAELALNPPLDFPKAVAGALASVVNKEAAYLERQATDPAVKREWQEFQADFNNRVLHAATGAGQWIASLKILSQSTPDGVVLTALRLIEDGVQRHVASYSRLLDQARTALNRAQETAAQDTLATPAIQDGARGAIGAALAADPEVHRFIAAEVVGALSQVPEVRRQITAKIRALLAGELRKQRTGEYWQGIAARGAGQLLKAIEKGLAPEGRAPATVDQFGSELTRILQQQINAALGVTPEAVSTRTYLQRLTTLVQNSERLSQVWGQVREQAARKYETEIRELEDLRQHSKLTDAGLQRLGQLKADWFGKVKPLLAKPVEVWSQQLLTATIRERLHEMTVRVSALAQQPDGSVAFGKLLADRISAATGLDEVSARSLNAALEKAYVDMVKAEKDKLAARIEQAQQSARERAARLRQSRSTWQRTKQGIAERLAKLLEAPSGEKPTALEDFGRRLAATLRRQLEPLAAERPEAARLTDIEAVREGITNADKYEDVWRQTQQEMREAWAKNPDGLALLDTFFRDVAPEPFALSTMDRLLRTKLREWNVRLGDAARKGQTGALRGRLGDALVKEGGLTGAAADKLRDAINKRFDTLATARKQKLLEQLLKPELPKTQRTLKLAFDRLAELNNIGALDQPTLAKIVAEKLGLKAALTPEQTAELRRLAEEMQAVPEGQLHKRQRLAQRIQSRIKQIGETRTGSLLDLAIGVWYSDVLSGLSNLVNLSGNLMQALASTSVMLGRNPRSAPLAVASLRGALGRAAWDGLDVLARGPLPHRTGLQVYGERRLERLKGWERVLTPLRYIGRALDAGDVIFHDPHEDMRFALLAALEARKSGLRGEALVRQVREQLHSSPGELAEARLQAAREGYQDRAARQRAHEIVHSRRDERLTRSAQEYARDTVYRGEPYGVLGALAKWMNEANRRWRLPIAIAPFPTLVSNFFNEAFNYVPPVAAYRLWKARPPQPGFFNFGRDGTLRGRPLDWTSVADQQLYYDQRAKLLVGLVGWSALNAAFSPRDGEDDKEWAIYGRGPRDAAKRKTWLAAGGKSNTIKLGGTSFDYSYWPIAPLLAVLGNWHDTLRWHRDDTTAGDRLAFGIWNTLRTVLDTPVLSGLARTLDVIEEPSEKGAAKKLAKFFAGPLAGFVPARGALSVIDRINDPQVYDGPGVKGAVLSQIPFARSHAAGQRPVLNGLGEPVRVHVSERFAKTAQPDATWSELARLNIGLYPRTLSVRDARGDSRDLSEEEIYQVVKRSGPRIRAHLERALAGADWQKRPDDYKRRVIEAYVQAERTAAKLRVTGAME
ncbi:MAG: hypothetical protein HW378_221, partial [Anaerolineales bacterium]|nr:hypothetical protein [Anaerolineales bacterium]